MISEKSGWYEVESTIVVKGWVSARFIDLENG